MPAFCAATRYLRHSGPSLRVAIIVVMLGFSTASLAAIPPRIDAQATVDLSGIKAANEYTAVIQSGAELAKLFEVDDAAAALTKANAALKTKEIDFDKQMLLVASPAPAGWRSTGPDSGRWFRRTERRVAGPLADHELPTEESNRPAGTTGSAVLDRAHQDRCKIFAPGPKWSVTPRSRDLGHSTLMRRAPGSSRELPGLHESARAKQREPGAI